jgi:hypothetical protein
VPGKPATVFWKVKHTAALAENVWRQIFRIRSPAGFFQQPDRGVAFTSITRSHPISADTGKHVHGGNAEPERFRSFLPMWARGRTPQ